jgi:hypothetical protein
MYRQAKCLSHKQSAHKKPAYENAGFFMGATESALVGNSQ